MDEIIENMNEIPTTGITRGKRRKIALRKGIKIKLAHRQI
jgi:hypothetical protein